MSTEQQGGEASGPPRRYPDMATPEGRFEVREVGRRRAEETLALLAEDGPVHPEQLDIQLEAATRLYERRRREAEEAYGEAERYRQARADLQSGRKV